MLLVPLSAGESSLTIGRGSAPSSKLRYRSYQHVPISSFSFIQTDPVSLFSLPNVCQYKCILLSYRFFFTF